MEKSERHEHAVKLGYTVRKEADGVYTLRVEGAESIGSFTTRDEAWARAYALSYEGIAAAEQSRRMDRAR